ncbi:PepSY domain-containing protein [Bacillus sp. FJAT-27251]|uniref:PepSY domain-containing protein n=1 Tax=Bacillus sp. FJAT-27251 TaxID=1684142 RepID=UPI0006A770B1|nr:PepSY domain-containing protein [Bacillus sp. FJAT-27251]
MKRKVLIIASAGLVLLGGAVGAGAFDDTGKAESQGMKEDKNIISMNEAEEIAIKEAGGSIESIELEKDDGRLIYEIELRSENGDDDVDVDVDAVTGEVLKVDRDDDDDDKGNVEVNREAKVAAAPSDDKNKASGPSYITSERAIEIATKESPGKVEDLELDDGAYEIEIKDGTHEYEYKIDAKTGMIIEKEIDRDDD